ncbi:MAG: alpha/beta hydrolase [Geminicoccaceae bacterium]|nr:alpha/beta hydrolase [Geminicoccaceae bacterium]MCB9969570.1 alpha/beta hydrolase [Geminicoccaceae bacterium]HRY25041.1 alpha/beta hydrolase [Geminicoccaceae bacterium]
MIADLDIDLDGRRLAARRIGDWGRDEPVLVFLHEGLGSISMWRDFPEALAARTGLPALIYDRFGYGRSSPAPTPWPPDFLRNEATEVLPALLAETGIGRPLVVGHSDGGTIALMFAAAFPDRPLACITLAAHVVLEARTKAGLGALAERWQDDADFRRRLSRHHDSADALVRAWLEVWNGHLPTGWNMLDDLARITCPVLAIQGELDEHGTLAQVDEITSRVAGPAEAAILAGCGHVPHLEQLEEVLAHIADFIAAFATRRSNG